ncbi:hypothetical protein M8C21_033922, partial [Ambrosia artemisiifolia]
VKELLDHVNRCCTSEKAVNIGGMAFTTSLNVLSNLMFSVDFAQYDSLSSQEFKDVVWAMMEVGGKPNLADFFPFLKLFDPQGLVRRSHVYGNKILTIFDRVIDQQKFMPERFLKVNIDYRGQDFELIPFGAGRRICPGLNMAHRMLHILLGSLIQKFDWKLVENMKTQDMDMDEKFGLTLQRNVPLKAIPFKI